jgi:hypothetical protein
MMNMIPQNDNFLLYPAFMDVLRAMGGDEDNVPLEVPGHDQTPAQIPTKD